MTRAIVRFSWSIASGWSMTPRSPPASRKRAELVVAEVSRVVVDRAAGRMGAEDRCPAARSTISANAAGEACARSRMTPSETSSSTSARPSRESPPSSAAPSENGFRRFHVSPAMRMPSSQNVSAGQSS